MPGGTLSWSKACGRMTVCGERTKDKWMWIKKKEIRKVTFKMQGQGRSEDVCQDMRRDNWAAGTWQEWAAGRFVEGFSPGSRSAVWKITLFVSKHVKEIPSANFSWKEYSRREKREVGAWMLDVGQGLNQSKDVPARGMGEGGRGEGIRQPGTYSFLCK